MLTRKQLQQRKQREQKEAAEKAKLAKQLGRNPDGSLPKEKKKAKASGTLDVNKNAKHLDVKLIAEAPARASDNKISHDEILQYDGWQEREAEAQIEIEKKKKRVAPLFNKGGYQYVTDETDPTTLGRKV